MWRQGDGHKQLIPRKTRNASLKDQKREIKKKLDILMDLVQKTATWNRLNRMPRILQDTFKKRTCREKENDTVSQLKRRAQMKKAHILEETGSTNNFGGIGNQNILYSVAKENPSTM